MSPCGSGASRAGCGMEAMSQLGSTSQGPGSAGHGRGHGHVEVNVGEHGCVLSAPGSSAAAPSGTPGVTGAGPGDGNVDMDHGTMTMTTMITRKTPQTVTTIKTMMIKSYRRPMPPRMTKKLTRFTCWLVLYAPTRTMAWAQWCS